jgi:hypothetical protein
MPEMTAADWARFRRAVQLRDRCNDAAVADGARLGLPVTQVQANVVHDAIEDIIRADERRRVADELAAVDGVGRIALVTRFVDEHRTDPPDREET